MADATVEPQWPVMAQIRSDLPKQLRSGFGVEPENVCPCLPLRGRGFIAVMPANQGKGPAATQVRRGPF
jgi:hypothetical protein